MTQIEEMLEEYDGKAVSILSEAQHQCRAAPGFLDDLIALVGADTAHLSDGASWILRAELDGGAVLSVQQVADLVARLPVVTAWQTELHLCQLLERLDLTARQAAMFTRWAAGLADHKRPFVRAWSVHALCVIARQHPDFRAEAERAIAQALEDPAASVRARARKLRV